jgi:predicted RNase H-like HicB family nuclease
MHYEKFPVVIEKDEDGVFIVSCPLFKGCHSYGHTIEEAMENIKEAIILCLEEEPDDHNKYQEIQELTIPIYA